MPDKIELTDNAKKVLEKRYLIKNEKGEVVETPEELFRRVAGFIAKGDEIYGASSREIKITEEKFYCMLTNLEFMPNSPTLMNAGRELGQLSACFVLPVEDSMEDIFEMIKYTALIHKCLVPETLVMTNRGLIQLNKVMAGDEILTDEGFFEVDSLHENGEQLIIEVVTRHGFSIKGTAQHKLMVVDENGDYIWRQIGELKKGDWIILKPGQWRGKKVTFRKFNFKEKPYLNSGCFRPQNVKIPEELTIELAELIGLYIGDGSNHRDGIRFCVGDEDDDLLELIKSISVKVFGKMVVISKGGREGSCEVSLLSVKIKKWFEETGIIKSSSRDARVPKFIFEAEEKEVCAFLRGLFSADGCIRDSGHITLSTSSVDLARQIQQIMLYLGIPLHKRYYSSTDSFQLSVCSKEGFTNFKEKIGFLNRKKKYRLESIGKNEIFLRGDTIPNQEFRLRKWYNDLVTAQKRLIQHRIDGLINRSNRRELSKQVAVDILGNEEVSPEFLKDLIKEDFLFDQIEKISPLSVGRVYDITVPTKHAYIADGFIGHNSGGGTGFSFSKLRPKNSPVRSTGGVSSGPVSFMKVFNAATEAVKQGGTRRGANMGILRIDHPDILEFIKCKEDDKQITNFNISIAITDEFMTKLERGENYDLIDPATKSIVKQLNTKEVFDLIVKMAWKNGEPGVIFIDRMNEFNPTPKIGSFEATNPCGEQNLLPYESCNLGSINLSRMVRETDEGFELDREKLGMTVDIAVHFLDDVITQNRFPLALIEKATLGNRKIGLGVMGWADLLIMLRIPYNSDEAVSFAGELMKFIQERSKQASRKLTSARGPFPNFKMSVYHDRGQAILRNATTTTIAPTGTISIIAGSCSSGIEPIFAISYFRQVMDNNKLVEINPHFEKIAKERGFFSHELLERIVQKGSIQNLADIPEDVRKVFVISHDITPEWHVRMQAAFQKYTDNAVSKTVNFPNDAAEEDVEKAYRLAYKLGCKGVTIYRDRSREEQVLNISKVENVPSLNIDEKRIPRKRPSITKGKTIKIGTGCGNLYITINEDEHGLCEVFSQMGKSGGCAASQSEATSRLVSLALRSGIAVDAILKQLRGIRCPSPLWVKGGMVLSCPDAIAKAIEMYPEDKKKADNLVSVILEKKEPSAVSGARPGNVVGVCPDCGNALVYSEGCMTCVDSACGYSKCS